MRLFSSTLFPLVSAFAIALAEPPPPTDAESTSPKVAALENLLSERESVTAFDKVIEEARKQGIGEQAILEARFLFHVDRHEDDAIAAMLPEFLKQGETFKVEDSEIFSVKEDWLAVTEYVQAIAALKKGNKEDFKKHITEAFWLSPRQGAAFAPHIDRMRLEDAMRAVKVDFTQPLDSLAKAEPVPLETLVTGKKALLLHFWSPLSQESADSMPDFAATAKMLAGKNVAVASVLPENTAEILTSARETIRPLGDSSPGAWLVDRKQSPLSRELRVQTLPSMVLLSTEGRVLFNGHPSDDALWEAFTKIDPEIERPSMTEAPDKP